MSRELRATMMALEESAWQPLETRDGAPQPAVDEQRHVADIPFVPEAPGITKHTPADRYVGIGFGPGKANCSPTGPK